MTRTPLIALAVAMAMAACSDDNGNNNTRKAGFVDQLEIKSTHDAYGGSTFGNVGAYQVISGVVHGKLDPNHAANAGIVDLKSAPVGSDGYVQYTTDFLILRPNTAASAKRVIFYDVVNRGNIVALGTFNGASPGFDAGKEGNALLLRQGYTLVFSGWQGNVAQTGAADTTAVSPVGASFPVAKNADGSSISGDSREEFVFDNATTPVTVALTYPANSLDKSQVTFNYRATWVTAGGMTWNSPSTAIAPAAWDYVDSTHLTINRPAGADQGAIYSFVYTAKDPVVMGIGFAAVRDFVTFLRRDNQDAQGNANPLNDLKSAPCAFSAGAGTCDSTTNIDVAVMEGVSQSGRMTRDFLWQGFNDDTRGHKVFEAMMPIIPGSRKTWTNYRFGQPGRWSKQHEDHFQRGDQFPFAYNVFTDPVSGVNDGLLKKCQASHTCPLVIHADGGFETWGARGLLVSTDGQGNDLGIPDNVRLYFVPGANHGGGNGNIASPVTQPQCSYASSSISINQPLRALALDLVAWASANTAPPGSHWPTTTQSAAATDRAAVGFPDLSGIGIGFGKYNQIFVTDYSNAVPVADLGKPYTWLVPKTDADGNDLTGIRVPDVVAPIATYTDWNIRKTGFSPGDGCYYFAAMFPFALTPGSRPAGDPRPALSERYTSKDDYVGQVQDAAQALVTERLLLDEDVAFYVGNAQLVNFGP